MWTHCVIVPVLIEMYQYEVIQPLWYLYHLPYTLFLHKELDIVRRRYRRLMVRTAATCMFTVDGTARGVAGFFRLAS